MGHQWIPRQGGLGGSTDEKPKNNLRLQPEIGKIQEFQLVKSNFPNLNG